MSLAISLYKIVKDNVPRPDDDPENTKLNSSTNGQYQSDQVYLRQMNGALWVHTSFESNFLKSCTRDEERYYGKEGDSFERKLKLFDERCMQIGIQDAEKPEVFSSCSRKGVYRVTSTIYKVNDLILIAYVTPSVNVTSRRSTLQLCYTIEILSHFS